MTHTIRYTSKAPPLDGQWDGDAWGDVEALEINHFHPQSSSAHRPRARARLLHDGAALHVLFRVSDRYVKSVCTEYGQQVCRDSCVEIFLKPRPDAGYFNLEINCGGTMLLWYIEDPMRVPSGGLKRSVEVPAHEAAAIGVFHSMPRHVPVEIVDAVEWRIQLSVPARLFERYVGALCPLGDDNGGGGGEWRGNLFKCADDTSHPHWAAWAPIGAELNFHAPQYFGRLRFERGGAG